MGEPLKISDVIKLLNKIENERGDIYVGTWDDGILKYIRGVKYVKAVNTGNEAVALQWWEE